MKETSTPRICVPLCPASTGDIADSITKAAKIADLIELRLDCLTESLDARLIRSLSSLNQDSIPPIIYTLRPAEQGGHAGINLETRLRFWLTNLNGLLSDGRSYADIELDLAPSLSHAVNPAPDWTRIICSHHDFARVPEELEQIYEQLSATKARILKIAVRACDITDCLPVMRLLERARSEGREVIAIAMGEAGILTRVLGPLRGSFLTYGSLDENQATAPGQLRAADLRDLYRIHRLDARTQVTGLLGQPVMHSVSPHIHNSAFAICHLKAVYLPLEVSNLEEFMSRMVCPNTLEMDWNLRGLSVTAPHKRAVMRYLDWIEPSAQAIGAVNTLIVEDKKLCGYNTDARAALAPLRGKIELRGARVALLGAGGAARALLWSLREAGARVTVFARHAEKAKETAQLFDAGYALLHEASFGEFELVVNATPLGTRGPQEDETAAVANQLRGTKMAYDLVYNPAETRFLREAREAGCQSIGGLEMLVAQAAAQFELWTGETAPLSVMYEAARKAVN